MRTVRSLIIGFCLACIAIALVGCHPQPEKQGYMAPPPKPLPPYPPAQPAAIDPALQSRATQELDAALKANDEIIRAHALEMVKQANPPDAATRIVAALGDNNWLVRKAAALAAGELQVQQATDRLNERLNDPNTQMPERLADIFALHRLGDPTHSHLFEQTSLDPDKRIRGDTAFMLGLLGDKSAVPILVNMLRSDKDAVVRLQAAEALWRLGDERGLDDLVGATVSMYPDDKMIALLALAQPHDTRMLGHVEGALTDDYPEVALVAARAAGMLGSDHGYGVALNGAKSDDPRQQLLAAMAFGAIGRADAQPTLGKLLDDKDADVRLAAAGALLKIAKPH
jgi:HEAT repeat protein